LPEKNLIEKVDKTLANLGLLEIKHIKVGNVLDKKISGGQRKRLNIALELIREPSVLFVDEPTSGLSSRDSENVIDLLKELSLKGKLIFTVIHQPSSDIYKMFDKVFILDTGGYPIYYGNPIEAVIHFKKVSNQINSEKGQCNECGNVNPEQIFNIIEAKVVDEYGQETANRKIKPTEWFAHYTKISKRDSIQHYNSAPPKSLHIPNVIKQWLVFTTRDVLSKLSNKQYLIINFLEAPVLALVLAFIIRYIANPDSDTYIFRENENIPAYLFMSIIVALFMGLTVSAEEIIRDRKILKREAFLNLSWGGYLSSKMGILFVISAIQTLSFVLIGNTMLGIKGLYLEYWIILFTVSCFANVLGLNISASFNSAVTIYILIPILLIPQMILSGAIFSFDKLNKLVGSRDKVPVVADFMASRWAFEALAVVQFSENKYQKSIYELEKLESKYDFKQAYLIPELKDKVSRIRKNANSADNSKKEQATKDLLVLKNELRKEAKNTRLFNAADFDTITLDNFDKTTEAELTMY
jgi:ABC transport system ATP-binding/permease protein